MNYDIVMLFSSNIKRYPKEQKKLLKYIGKFLKAKKSLYLWCDNTPYHEETDIILKKYFDGMHMQGDYFGDKENSNNKIGKVKIDKTHYIGYGIDKLDEGISDCFPQKIHPDFKHLAYNQQNQPMISYAEKNKNHGRIILDYGFTKLFQMLWDKPGNQQLLLNCTVWLTGVPK